MTTEAPSRLVPVPPEWLAAQGTRARNVNRNINDIYWSRSAAEMSPGYIMVGPSAIPGVDGRPITAQAESWVRKGRKPLIDYSYTDRVSPQTGHRETIELTADRLGTPDWAYWFFRNGGAPLFPIEQIVEHHWHINPPYGMAREVFPQLDEWDVPEPFYCGACAGAQPPRNSEEELVTHLLINHRMTLPQARDLIESYDVHAQPRGALGLSLRRKSQRIEAVATESVLIQPSPDQPPARLLICDQCGESFTIGFAKGKHMREAHGAAASQPGDANGSPAEGQV